jgi:hypothetical protein
MSIQIGKVLKIVLFVLLAAYTFYYHSGFFSSGEVRSVIAEHENVYDSQLSQTKLSTKFASEGGGAESSAPTVDVSLAAYRRALDWDSLHGYYSQEDYDIYASYDENTLQSLSATGDVKAMYVLANLYIKQGGKREDVVGLFKKMAVYGATASLPQLASYAEIDMLKSQSDKTPETRIQGVVNILAYYKLAELRGDPRASSVNAYKAIYKSRYGEELLLTKEQLDLVDEKARSIYSELQQERYNIGLGEFDNSTHQWVDLIYKK